MEKLMWQQMCNSMAMSYDKEQHTRSKVESYNATPGNLKGLDCPKCLNRGSIAHPGPNNTPVFSECSCMKARRAIERMERAGLGECMKKLTFDKFQDTDPWQKKIKKGAMAYAADPQGWFLICGQSGSGKTHICTAICQQLLSQHREVQYMSWLEESARLKTMLLEDPEREKLLTLLKSVPVLYIDDLFKTGADDRGRARPTVADIKLAFEIINHRYNSNKATIVSTERYAKELLAVDVAVCSRILERAGKHVYEIKASQSRNYRLRNIPLY